MWNGDSIQFGCVNLLNGGRNNSVEHFTELWIALTSVGPLLYSKQSIDSNDLVGNPVKDGEIAIVRGDGVTTYEFRVAWHELLYDDTVVNADLPVAFSMLVNDNDGNGRRGWVEYNSGIGYGKNMTQFGRLHLIEKEMEK